MKLDTTLIGLIQDNRGKSIQEKQLTAELLEVAHREKWFNIWVPKSLSGLELPLVDGCRFLEELAYWDGGLSWTITLCAGANMFVGFIDGEEARKVFADPTVCFGGSGKIGGQAIAVEGGYKVSGKWPYATGAPHLTHFTANALLHPQDERDDGQTLEFKSMFIPRDEVLIHYDWNTFGLEATASHSFSVDGVFVPYSQTFDILPEKAKQHALLFQYPFRPFADLTLFVNYLGIFRRFCDLVQKYFHQKSSNNTWNEEYGSTFFKLLDDAQQLATDSSGNVYALASQSWDNLLYGHVEENESLYQEIAGKTRLYVQQMKGHFMELYPKCGIQAAQYEGEMNGVFRNFFTATQHSLLNVRT